VLESELHTLLEGTADAAFVVDVNGFTRIWNRAAERLFGYPSSQAAGSHCADLIDGRDALGSLVCRRDCTVLGWCAAGREIPNFDLEARTHSGSRIWVNVSILPLHDRYARRRYAIHLVRDIQPVKKREEFCERLMQAAQDLVALRDGQEQAAPAVALTDQEQRILRSLAKGASPAAITAKLNITSRTLRNHLYNINRKLGTRSRLAAVVHATQRGLI